jgi:hypothetical protein
MFAARRIVNSVARRTSRIHGKVLQIVKQMSWNFFRHKYCYYLECDYRRRFGLVNGFIDHIYTRFGTKSSYRAAANLQNSLITTAPFKLFQPSMHYKSFSGNGFWQWKVSSFTLSSPLFTVSRTELTWSSKFSSLYFLGTDRLETHHL